MLVLETNFASNSDSASSLVNLDLLNLDFFICVIKTRLTLSQRIISIPLSNTKGDLALYQLTVSFQ